MMDRSPSPRLEARFCIKLFPDVKLFSYSSRQQQLRERWWNDSRVQKTFRSNYFRRWCNAKLRQSLRSGRSDSPAVHVHDAHSGRNQHRKYFHALTQKLAFSAPSDTLLAYDLLSLLPTRLSSRTLNISCHKTVQQFALLALSVINEAMLLFRSVESVEKEKTHKCSWASYHCTKWHGKSRKIWLTSEA
jgi:hypothetical protein